VQISSVIESSVRARGAALMGVVNTTPDSFYDGGLYTGDDAARARVDELMLAKTTVLDIGAESSRPGSAPVPAAEQIARMEAALEYAVSRGALVSVDTTDPEVADHALGKGARIVNDVSCLANEELAAVAARHGAALILMHSRGPMQKMAGFSQWPDDAYGDVVRDVFAEWADARERAMQKGLEREAVWMDPGLGFSKNARHSLELLRRLPELRGRAPFLVVGPGRKSFIASVDPSSPSERLGGTVAACLAAVEGGAEILRVHDVREVNQALLIRRALTLEPKAEVRRAV
jgi:dihydropteroate synthase